jgi:hypothetical protein
MTLISLCKQYSFMILLALVPNPQPLGCFTWRHPSLRRDTDIIDTRRVESVSQSVTDGDRVGGRIRRLDENRGEEVFPSLQSFKDMDSIGRKD